MRSTEEQTLTTKNCCFYMVFEPGKNCQKWFKVCYHWKKMWEYILLRQVFNNVVKFLKKIILILPENVRHWLLIPYCHGISEKKIGYRTPALFNLKLCFCWLYLNYMCLFYSTIMSNDAEVRSRRPFRQKSHCKLNF